MDRIGVVGLSWRRGGPELLTRFTLPSEEREQHVARLAQKIGAEELVYLATCNRIELAFVCAPEVKVEEVRRRVNSFFSNVAPSPGEAQRTLQAWEGEGAVEHIFLVAMGLDSVRLGETEILGQVRTAVDLSRTQGLCKGRLEPVFSEALKLAKRGRSETQLELGHTSLAEIGLQRVRAVLQLEPGPLGLLGISAMTERCARELVEEGHEVWLINRSFERAEALAAEFGSGARALGLAEFLAQPPPLQVLISATGAPGAVLREAELARLWNTAQPPARPLLVDFASDPDLQPEAAQRLGFERLGMQEMLTIAESTRRDRLAKSGEARSMVDEALDRMAGKLGRRSVDRAIGTLREVWLETAQRELEKMISKHFGDIDEVQAEALRKFATRLSKHFAHVPASGLRHLAQSHGAQLVQDFFQDADGELAARLGDALDTGSLFSHLGEGNSQ